MTPRATKIKAHFYPTYRTSETYGMFDMRRVYSDVGDLFELMMVYWLV